VGIAALEPPTALLRAGARQARTEAIGGVEARDDWGVAGRSLAQSNGAMPGELSSASLPTVVVIDDEPGIVDFIELGLGHEGVSVVTAGDVASGLDTVRRVHPQLVILDVGLPDGDGFDLLRVIRGESDVPVIMLTARGDLDDRVRGLDLGADDYIAKPFHFAELLARVRAQLRRAGVTRSDDPTLHYDDLELDPRTREVRRAGASVTLTAREFELLELFMRHPRQVLSKEAILDRLWGYAFDDNLVEVYVGYLRRKLGEPVLIQTLRGAGYALREPG
jgi:two-component system response regulator MprA